MLLAERVAGDAGLKGAGFNFSNELQITVSDLVGKILQRMNSGQEPDIRNEASNEIRHQYLSAAKARRRLSWAPLLTVTLCVSRI